VHGPPLDQERDPGPAPVIFRTHQSGARPVFSLAARAVQAAALRTWGLACSSTCSAIGTISNMIGTFSGSMGSFSAATSMLGQITSTAVSTSSTLVNNLTGAVSHVGSPTHTPSGPITSTWASTNTSWKQSTRRRFEYGRDQLPDRAKTAYEQGNAYAAAAAALIDIANTLRIQNGRG
jgi:hypothetical protein